VRFLVTYVIETLVNEWDSQCDERNEGVHFLSWVGREEESWWKIGITIGEYQ
jgi:hypothetical protein